MRFVSNGTGGHTYVRYVWFIKGYCVRVYRNISGWDYVARHFLYSNNNNNSDNNNNNNNNNSNDKNNTRAVRNVFQRTRVGYDEDFYVGKDVIPFRTQYETSTNSACAARVCAFYVAT